MYRPIVENYFGRLKVYWQKLAHPCKNFELHPDMIMVCVALTNILVAHFPLRMNRRPESEREILWKIRDDHSIMWDELPSMMQRVDLRDQQPPEIPQAERPPRARVPPIAAVIQIPEEDTEESQISQEEEEAEQSEEDSGTESEEESPRKERHSVSWQYDNRPTSITLRSRKKPRHLEDFEVPAQKRHRSKK
jgi:hypothetical protein